MKYVHDGALSNSNYCPPPLCERERICLVFFLSLFFGVLFFFGFSQVEGAAGLYISSLTAVHM